MTDEKGENTEEVRNFSPGQSPNVAGGRCSVLSSTLDRLSGEDSKCVADRLVKNELDAARTLAHFAQLLLLESENPGSESRGKWSNKRRRSRKRVKEELPVRDREKRLESSESKRSIKRSSDLVQEYPSIMNQHQSKTVCEIVTMGEVKVEQDAGLPGSGALCSTGYLSFPGGNSRQNLIETEKEARRLRRVLANRESARQTIRRRLALSEELTRKAAELAWDNENMKREKETVIKEFQLLKDRNKKLKAQMAKTAKAVVEDTSEKRVSTHVDYQSYPSTKCPYLAYNRPPFPPFLWPSIFQPLPVQTPQIPQNAVSSNNPTLTTESNQSPEQGLPLGINRHGTPFIILPCPFLFPLPHQTNDLHPAPLDPSTLRDSRYEPYDNQINEGSSSSKAIGNSRNHAPEALSSTETKLNNNLPEPSDILTLDGGVKLLGPDPKGMILMPAPTKCLKTISPVKCENGLQPEPIPDDEEAFSSTASHAIPEKNQELSIFLNRKVLDAVAAAEARKRRKEITKLKSLHGRQSRMHY